MEATNKKFSIQLFPFADLLIKLYYQNPFTKILFSMLMDALKYDAKESQQANALYMKFIEILSL